MLVNERACPEEPQFLGVGKEHDHVVTKRGACPQRPERLQDGNHAHAVVAGSDRDLATVIMRGDENSPAPGLRPRNPRQHVVNRRDPGKAGLADGCGAGLDRGLVAHLAKPRQQVLARSQVPRRSGRAGGAGNLLKVLHRPC